MNGAGDFGGNYAGMGMLLDHDSLSRVRGGGNAGGSAGDGAGMMGGGRVGPPMMG